MTRHKPTAADALLEQSRTVRAWLGQLSEDELVRPTELAGWDVRGLVGHLLVVHRGLSVALGQPSRSRPVPLFAYVQGYRPGADAIRTAAARATAEVEGAKNAATLVAQLDAAVEQLAVDLGPDRELPAVVLAPRGPLTLDDLLASRIIEVVVHADDLSRSLPEREPVQQHRSALGRCSRALANILAARHPGRSVEVRIPPYAAVQCGVGDPGPTHTRGTPPNVVETDAVTFFRLATGRTSWSDAGQTGQIHASGLRADLTSVLPLLS